LRVDVLRGGADAPHGAGVDDGGVTVLDAIRAEEVWVMKALSMPRSGAGWRHQIREPQVVVSLVAAACLLAEAVIAKNVIDVELDVFSQFVPMWLFIVYLVSGLSDRTSAIAFITVIVLATAAVLVLYAV
jgi:hypothetical protein